MEPTRNILFYGNSVILGALGSSLRNQPKFQVTILLPPFPERQWLEDLKPDVIFFDMEADCSEEVFSLLETCSDILLIGISPDKNHMKIWSGQELKELSTQDLIGVIDSHSKRSLLRHTKEVRKG